MMSPEMESRFRAFLSTQEGQQALEEEEFHAESHLERRQELAARRKLRRSSKELSKQKKRKQQATEAGRGLRVAVGGAVAGYMSALTALAFGDAEKEAAAVVASGARVHAGNYSDVDSDEDHRLTRAALKAEEGGLKDRRGVKRVKFDALNDGWRKRGGKAMGVQQDGAVAEDSASASSDGQISDEEYDSAEEDEDDEARTPVLPPWLSWASISQGLAPVFNSAHDSVHRMLKQGGEAAPGILAQTSSVTARLGAATTAGAQTLIFDAVPRVVESTGELVRRTIGGADDDDEEEEEGEDDGGDGKVETPLVPLVETVIAEVSTHAAAATVTVMSFAARQAYDFTYMALTPVRKVLQQIVVDAQSQPALTTTPNSPAPPSLAEHALETSQTGPPTASGSGEEKSAGRHEGGGSPVSPVA